MFVRICALSALLVTALAGPAASRDDQAAEEWGQVGGWQIRVDREAVKGCFALQGYEDGTAVRLGIGAGTNSIYLLLGNMAWESLEAGRTYPLRFVFDDITKYESDLVGYALGPLVVLADPNVSAAFMADFAQRSSVRIYFGDQSIAHLSLRGAFDALVEVVLCQKATSAAGGTASSRMRPAGDPLAR